MASVSLNLENLKIQGDKKRLEREKKMENYSTFQLYNLSEAKELLSGISLAGFRYNEKYPEAPDMGSNTYSHITDLFIGQIIEGTVSRGNRLGWAVDIAMSQEGFLHKANLNGHLLKLGSCISVRVTNLDFAKSKITLELVSVLKNDKPAVDPALLNVSSKMSCSVCCCDFLNREEQVQHYKLDWHRYNLKQKITGEDPITEEMFDKLANDDDLSSLSGTDSDKSDEDEEGASDSAGCNTSGNDALASPRRKLKLSMSRFPQRERSDSVNSTDTEGDDDRNSSHTRYQPKIFLCNGKGNLLALFTSVVHGKKNTPDHQRDLLSLIQAVPLQMKWAVIIMGGGHFAAAIFDGGESIAHKTFHRYTCRAKQGGSQSAKDQAGRPPKSGGATLRRYNEAALVKDIQDLMSCWGEDLQSCNRIFFRAASFNRITLFGGKNPPLNKTDPRLRTIPFPTRRATYNEVKRIHKMLSTLECFGDRKQYENTLPQSPKVHLGNKSPKKSFSNKKENSTNQKSKIVLPTTLEVVPDNVDAQNENDTSKPSDSEEDTDLTLVEEVHNLNDLKTFDHTKKKKRGKRKSSLPRRQVDPVSTPLDGEEYQFKTALYSACKMGNLDKLLNLLNFADKKSELEEKENNNSPESVPNNLANKELLDNYVNSPLPTELFQFSLTLLNEPFGEGGSTYLHVASKEGHRDLVRILMEHGASPCIKNKNGHTPYTLAEDKETRKEFRRFWDLNPDKFDYLKSQIPGPLTDEQLVRNAERNKERKKGKKERGKEKKLEIATRKAEEEEQRRFLNLSDREKRALAAERRMIAEMAAVEQPSISILSRCFLCAADISGKVPFEYNNCRFCSIKCVKEHRKQN